MIVKGSVLQDWVQKLSWKEQTVLLCALRGPDHAGSPEIKGWVRWIRRRVLNNAAPNKTFMQVDRFKTIREIADLNPLALDMLPVHYVGHFAHALQIIGYRTADAVASEAYLSLCDYLHLKPESIEDMTRRLADEV